MVLQKWVFLVVGVVLSLPFGLILSGRYFDRMKQIR